jgi:hypothetical protein
MSFATVDLPEAIDPVNPIMFILILILYFVLIHHLALG